MRYTWKSVPLAELTENGSPITYGVVKPGGAGDVAFIRGGDLSDGRILVPQLRTISREVSTQYKRTLLKGGELLISLVGVPGQVAVVPSTLAGANIARQVGLIRLRKDICADFISYFLQSPEGRAALGVHTGGSVQQVINLRELRTVPVPNPPLAEQRRIVAILDEAFAGIAQAVAAAEKNLANARELFEGYLNAVFDHAHDGWVQKSLEEFADQISTGPFGSLLHKSDYLEGGIPLVNPINIVGEQIVPDARKAIGEDTHRRLSKYHLSEGDIVIGRRGEIGRCAVVGSEQAGWLCGTGCFVITPSAEANPYFLAHLLRSRRYREVLEGDARRATMPNLSNKDLAGLAIQLPSVPEQTRFLARLDELRAETQRLESLYRRKLAALAELKQSLLQKAFAGELTAGVLDEQSVA